MKGERLSIPQQAALEILAEQEAKSSVLTAKGVHSSTLSSLDRRSLITLLHYGNGWFWSITDSGRAALSAMEDGR